jgi:hypothetical protein
MPRSIIAFVVALAVTVPLGVAKAQPAQSSASPSGGLYRGKTTQRWNVNLRVAASGRKITLFASQLTVYCRASGDYTDNKPFLPRGAAAISASGSFSHKFSRGDGVVYKYRGRFVTARKAVGTLTMSSVKIIFGGTEVCVTPGTVRWTATRR